VNNILEVKNLSVAYDGERVLNNINLDIIENEIISIVGESGSGKTTLLNSMIHMLNPNAVIEGGSILFEGKDLMKYDESQWRSLRGDAFGMIFQNAKAFLNPIRKIGKQFEDTICAHRKVSKKEARNMAYVCLEKMGFNDVDRILDSFAFQLSGGMNQRVAIAMCLVMEPKIILADEPTSALDVLSQVQVTEELRRIRDQFNTTIIMVTHNIGCAAHISDRLVVMRGGLIEEFGPTEKIIRGSEHVYTNKLLQAIPELKGNCSKSNFGACDERYNFTAV
jgi:peptide/nickel transport system ATP-binding protein